VRANGLLRSEPVGSEGQSARVRVVGVGAELAPKGAEERVVLYGLELVGRAPVLRLRPDVEQGLGLAVQPVRRPVRRLVRAVAPDRADLLTAEALPDLLAVEDGVARGEELAARGHHALGDGRRLPVDLAAEEAEEEGRAANDEGEREPRGTTM
jgi:hypothetical protein